MVDPGKSNRKSRRQRLCALILCTILGAIFGLFYHELNPLGIEDLPRSFKQPEYIAKIRLQRVVIGAVVGCYAGVAIEVAVVLYRGNRKN
jgi:hypothetical protein